MEIFVIYSAVWLQVPLILPLFHHWPSRNCEFQPSVSPSRRFWHSCCVLRLCFCDFQIAKTVPVFAVKPLAQQRAETASLSLSLPALTDMIFICNVNAEVRPGEREGERNWYWAVLLALLQPSHAHTRVHAPCDGWINTIVTAAHSHCLITISPLLLHSSQTETLWW